MESFNFTKLPVKNYSAAGGVVVYGQTIMVFFVPGRSEYRLPKGHIEKKETAEQTALREVSEESGYIHLSILADLGNQTVKFDDFNRVVVREEHYFLINLDSQDDQNPPEAKFKPVWMTWPQAMQRITYEAEREWLRRAQSAWNNLQNNKEDSHAA